MNATWRGRGVLLSSILLQVTLGKPDRMHRITSNRRLGILVGLLWFAGAPIAGADGLRAGQWQTSQSAEINGVAGPPQQNTRCLTPDAVADLDRTFSPISRTTNSTCERVEHELTPQRLKWRLQCTGQLDMEVAGEFTFDSPEHYSAVITARSSMQGRLLQTVRTSIEGRRLGDCP
jgi:hypothetical protein